MTSCKEKLDLTKLSRFVAPFEDDQQCFGFRHLVAQISNVGGLICQSDGPLLFKRVVLGQKCKVYQTIDEIQKSHYMRLAY